MTQPLDLAPIEARYETYAAIHSASGVYAHCAAQESAEDVPALTAEVTRLRELLAAAETRIAAVVAIPTATEGELEQLDPEEYQQAIGYGNALWEVQQALTGDDPYEGVCFAGTGAPAALEG